MNHDLKNPATVALFIDAENIGSKFAKRLMEEVSNYGTIIVKRIYADWSSTHVKEWKSAALDYALVATQQFCAVKGKNSSDISLVLDVMKVLFENRIDIFCIASSDSDFTRLIQELRERQKVVIGFGNKQTIPAYINSFSEFIYLDDQELNVQNNDKASLLSVLGKSRTQFLLNIIDALLEDRGRALYSQISNEMKNKYSDFVPKNYGYKTMKDLMLQLVSENKKYEIARDKVNENVLFVRAKKIKSKSEDL